MTVSTVCSNCTLRITHVICRSCFKSYNIDAERCPKCGEPNLQLCTRCWTHFQL